MSPRTSLHFGATYSLSQLVTTRNPALNRLNSVHPSLQRRLDTDDHSWDSAANDGQIVLNPVLQALSSSNINGEPDHAWLQAYLRTGYFHPATGRGPISSRIRDTLGADLLASLSRANPSQRLTPMGIYQRLQDALLYLLDDIGYQAESLHWHHHSAQHAFQDNLATVRRGLQNATPESLLNLLDQTDKLKEHLRGTSPQSSVRAALSLIDHAKKQLLTLKAMNDLPMLVADDMIRRHYHYLTPEQLERSQIDAGWEVLQATNDREPVADVIVIGLGPGGIAGATAAKNFGANVVAFDATYAMRAFSDAGAYGIHTIRTNTQTTSMFQQAVRPKGRRDDLATLQSAHNFHSLATFVGAFLQKGQDAITSYATLTGKIFPEPLFSYSPNSPLPVTRSSLAQYGDELIDRLVQRTYRKSAFVVEQAPIESIRKREDGLIEVTSSRGHRQLGRNLLLATGMTGSQGQNAKVPAVFEDLANNPNYLLVRNSSDLAKKNTSLEQAYQSMFSNPQTTATQLIITDHLIGDSRIQRYLTDCKPGTRCLVVGSGESAGKAALEVLRHHPNVIVDFVCKGPIETAQIQIPEINPLTSVLQKALRNKSFGKKLFRDWKYKFGTPITPNTYKKLLEKQEAGQIRIYEMDQHVNETSVRLVPQIEIRGGKPIQTTRVNLRSAKTAEHILARQKALRKTGLINPAEGPILSFNETWQLPNAYNGPIILATGYDHKQKQENPLNRQLLEQGLAIRDPETGEVVTKKGSGVWITGMGGIQSAGDSTIFGNTARAIHSVGEMLGVQTTPRTARIQRAPGILKKLPRAIAKLPEHRRQGPLALAALKAYPWDATNLRMFFADLLENPIYLAPSELATLVSRERSRLRMMGSRAVLKAIPRQYRANYREFLRVYLPEMSRPTWRNYFPFAFPSEK